MYYIAIDGGGTKTQFDLYDEKGNLLEQMHLPSCHILQNEFIDVVNLLKTGVSTLAESIDSNDIFVCAGLAGYGKDPKMRSIIEKACEQAFAPYEYQIYNDSQIAMAGALDGNDGILLIAGTGSIAFAKKDNQEYRCGGWGYMLDDAGSAYWIGKALLSHYCHQCDGRETKTGLVDALMQACGLQEPYEMIPYIATTLGNKRDEIAKLALVVSTLAKQQDPIALKIYEDAAKALAQSANVLGALFKEEVELSYVGGVWNSPELMDFFQMHIHHHIEVVSPKYGPAYGAFLLAKQIVENRKKD